MVEFSWHHRRRGFVSMSVKETRRTATVRRTSLLTRLTIEAVMNMFDFEQPTTQGNHIEVSAETNLKALVSAACQTSVVSSSSPA